MQGPAGEQSADDGGGKEAGVEDKGEGEVGTSGGGIGSRQDGSARGMVRLPSMRQVEDTDTDDATDGGIREINDAVGKAGDNEREVSSGKSSAPRKRGRAVPTTAGAPVSEGALPPEAEAGAAAAALDTTEPEVARTAEAPAASEDATKRESSSSAPSTTTL